MKKTNIVFVIYARYETRNKLGEKEFTKWFRESMYKTKEEAKEALNDLKELSKPIDKSTKLKHEYEIRELDETLIPQPRLHRPKGRPKSIERIKLDAIIADLNNKNGIARIPNDIKLYLYNDDKAQEYIWHKFPNKWIRYWYDENQTLFAILKNYDEKIYD